MESTTTSYNMRSPAVKRLLKEARELQQDTCSDYTAQPLENNLFEWHFVIRGPDSTEFEGGRYHGRILLPSEYPFKPPNLMLMTQNGRFELNKKICLSITGYHPEYWLPAWGSPGDCFNFVVTKAKMDFDLHGNKINLKIGDRMEFIDVRAPSSDKITQIRDSDEKYKKLILMLKTRTRSVSSHILKEINVINGFTPQMMVAH
ncbi:15745_t:CDS:2 [Entrophospora sp. SA101]|nr:15745_t:CDS:2 [Entrophospora sp. SA101]